MPQPFPLGHQLRVSHLMQRLPRFSNPGRAVRPLQAELGDEITRTIAWGRALSAIFQANPTSCQAPDATNTSIEVTQQPDSSGAWQERWNVACGGGTSIPVDMTFTPTRGGMFNIKAKIAK